MRGAGYGAMRSYSRAVRPGMVLLAVLVVIVLASLVGTTVLIVADADRAGAEVSLHRTQSRAVAWSGVQAVMAELADQREELLDGRKPRVTEEWTVVGDDRDAERGVFRLVPLGVDGPLVSEPAKLDLNSATVEMLSRLPGVGPDLAAKIVAARDAAPLPSVEALLSVEGIGPDLLYGPVSDGTADPRTSKSGPGAGTPPLADLVTVFSFDPNVQLGLGPRGEGHRGELRLNINSPWSEPLHRALAKRFDEDFANGVKGIMANRKFERDSDMAAVLIEFKVEPKDWLQTFDVFTTTPDHYLPGRVDLNTASAEVLASVPGIDEAAAGRIVGLRGRLDEDMLRSITWPAVEEVLTPEQFQAASDHLTTRSMQWRVRVEAGFETVSEVSQGLDGAKVGNAPKLRDRIVLEAVIDVASERPRVAYLRDITLLDTAREAFARSGAGEAQPAEIKQPNRAAEPAAPADEMDADAQGPSRPSRLGRTPSRISAAQEQREERLRPDPEADMVPDFSPVPDAEDAPVIPTPAPEAADIPEAGPDRRIGRWNPAGGSQGGRR